MATRPKIIILDKAGREDFRAQCQALTSDELRDVARNAIARGLQIEESIAHEVENSRRSAKA